MTDSPDPLPRARPDFSYTPSAPRPDASPRPRPRNDTPGSGTPGDSPPASGAPQVSPDGSGSLLDSEDNGSGGGPGGGGNNGGNGGNQGDGDDDPPPIIYCYCCGHPWWDCHWCRFWSPMCWCYCGFDWYFWDSYWRPGWDTRFIEFHNHYDFSSYYPSIYTAPALVLDPSPRVIEYLDQGAALFRERNYREALKYFRLAHLADLDFAIARFAYAQALFALGLYDFAAQEIRIGLTLMPDWLDIGGNLTLMYGEEQDFDDQLAALTAHLKIFHDDERALLVLGYVSYFTGDLYLAEKIFDRLYLSQDAAYVATSGAFRNSVNRIKQRLVAAGKKDDALLRNDGVTIEEILQR